MKAETVAYARRGSQDLLADVYRPEGTPKAAVILLHGGGWRVGSREAIAPSAQALARLGFLALPQRMAIRTGTFKNGPPQFRLSDG